jgi:hypothetical protein
VIGALKPWFSVAVKELPRAVRPPVVIGASAIEFTGDITLLP